MNNRHHLALSSPVKDLSDTKALSPYTRTVVNDVGMFGTILTVDVNLWWHARVSILSEKHKPILLKDLPPSSVRAAEDLARELLRGVGRPKSDEVMRDEKAIHILRKLTFEELTGARSGITANLNTTPAALPSTS